MEGLNLGELTSQLGLHGTLIAILAILAVALVIKGKNGRAKFMLLISLIGGIVATFLFWGVSWLAEKFMP